MVAAMAVFVIAGGFLSKIETKAAGEKVFTLTEEGGKNVGSFDSWQDVAGAINSAGKNTMVYHVLLADNVEIAGNMKMPGKGKYAGIILEKEGAAGSGSELGITVTGNVPMTGDLAIGDGISLSAKGVAGGAYCLSVGEDADLYASGAVTAGTLILCDDAAVKTGGKLTVKKTLEAQGSVDITLTEKKGASIKDTVTISGVPVSVRIQDKSGAIVTPAQNAVLFQVTGDSYAGQYESVGADETAQTLYRKGNTLRVLGAQQIAAVLYDETAGVEDLGGYLSLADVKAEISRRKRKTAVYRVGVTQQQFIKGALPMPTVKTYEKIIFSGEDIRLTGALKLTGETEFENSLIRVKSASDATVCPLDVNLAGYKLWIRDGQALEPVGNVNGGKGSVLEIAEGAFWEISGNLKVDRLNISGELKVGGSFTAGNITAGAGNCLYYNADKKSTVSGVVDEAGAVLLIAPQRGGETIKTWAEGATVMSSVPKADVQRFALMQDTPYVLYRDKNALKLGNATISLFDGTTDYEDCKTAADSEVSGRFVTFNDVIVHANLSGKTDFVARIDEDTVSGGKLTTLESGKHLILCSVDGEVKKLRFTGSVALSGSTLEVRGVLPDNGTTAGTPISLKNGASIFLENTEVKTVSAGSGTSIVLAGNVTLKGAVSGQGSLEVYRGAVIRAQGNIAAGTMTLTDGQAALDALGSGSENTAEFRMLSGRKMKFSGAVSTTDGGYFTINIVDKKDVPANIGRGTVLISAKEAQATQFVTHNIVPGTYQEWFLIKKGNNICTSQYSYGDGEWSGDFL